MRRHPFDPFSFFFGVVFAVTGIAFATGRIDLTGGRLSGLWPFPVVALGLLLLVLAVHGSSEPAAGEPGVPEGPGPEDEGAGEQPNPAPDEER